MDRKSIFTLIAIYGLVAGIGFFARNDPSADTATSVDSTAAYIIQGGSAEGLADALEYPVMTLTSPIVVRKPLKNFPNRISTLTSWTS